MSERYQNLLVTVEHAATGKMGGIGSYNNEIDKLVDNLLIFLIDDSIEQVPADNIILCHQYIAQYLPEIAELYEDPYTHHYAILKAVQHVLANYPEIRHLDTHEYAAEAFCIVEAARMGLLGSVVVRVHCHGGRIQLERATGEWGSIESARAHILERAIMEDTDEIWLPSQYLKKLYMHSGVKLQSATTRVLGLPYKLPESFKQPVYRDIEQIVFVGRVNRLKGYDVLAQVLHSLLKKNQLPGIKRVEVIGSNDGTLLATQGGLKHDLAEKGIAYHEGLKTRDEVLSYIHDHAGDSLFILPYYSDNYSVALLEIIEAAAPLLSLSTGGNAELVDSPLWRGCLAANAEELAVLTQAMLKRTSKDRQQHCLDLRAQFVTDQIGLNEANKQRFYTFPKSKKATKVTAVTIKVLEAGAAKHPETVTTGEDYVLVMPPEAQLRDAKQISTLLAGANAKGSVNLLTFGYMMGGKTVIPDPSDIADIALNHLKHRVLCVKTEHYNSYVAAVKQKQLPHYGYVGFVGGLLTYLLAEGERVRVCPEVVADIPKTTFRPIDEAVYHTYVACLKNANWDLYRYMSLLRSGRGLGVEKVLTSDTDRLSDILQRGQHSTGIKGKAVRGFSKTIVGSAKVAVKLRRLTK